MDTRLKHPFPMLVAGPTSSGKSHFVKRLLEGGEETIQNPPDRIIWCYGIDQQLYHEMQETMPNISFVEGIPNDLETSLDPSVRNVIVLDDMMQELSRNPRIANLFTKGSHHLNLSVIFIVQNLFHKGKELRDISLNCHYLVIFKSPRDNSQIIHLAKQMHPGNVKFVQESFIDATAKPYGYLLCDLKPETKEDFRLRTNIFPGEQQIAYIKIR